ncbi:hypothetical protein FIA58_000530 [Flavobacterium jejuense]|uniref:Uncharacterized protein n=1 Tax=Flavobacterium jejuense TaxID=1544455 RepID=A0ABX0INU7_9FLAO|nr:hypothetical protein [Flavobacterium jejuense]NHN24148.1 hypothetical protein [Flavobacterium jejuense]
MNKILNNRQLKTIQNFWRWIEDNETNIYNAMALGIKTDEVMQHLERNLNYVSKRLGYIIVCEREGVKLYITAFGQRKLFPKLIALEETIPKLTQLIPSAFIKPIANKEPYRNKQDDYFVFSEIKVKISDLYLQLDDFNTTSKKINITVFHPYKETKNLYEAIETMIALVIGEVAFKKHVKNIEIKPIANNTNGLLQLIELDEYITYLYSYVAFKRIKI